MQLMGFANYPAWDWFNKQFPQFVEKYAALEELRDKMFVRKIHPKHHADYVVYGLGRVCVEDFEQVLNLCGNGFGIGAMQLLRGMYERQVTAAYLSRCPDEVDSFVEYSHIQLRRAMNQLKEVYHGERAILDGIVSEERRSEIEKQYQGVKDKFMDTLCKECETTKEMFSWTKLSTGALALKGGQGLDKLYHYQYFRPTLLSHSTFKSVEARVVFGDDGSFSFESEGQQKYIKEALIGGHNLLLNVFDLQNKHFNLGLDSEIEQSGRDYLECWAPNEVPTD